MDPAPPPLVCTDVVTGQTLTATGTLEGSRLVVKVRHEPTWRTDAYWSKGTGSVSALQNATLVSVAPESDYSTTLRVTLDLAAASVTSGSFLLEATLTDYEGKSCSVKRSFTFTISGGGVQVAEQRRRLPLGTRGEARIELVRRQGREVELRARATPGGRIGWTVSGGSLCLERGRVRWTLPEAAGLYQAELLVDHGEEGLALDTLVLEVV